jgi:hypothetical protein
VEATDTLSAIAAKKKRPQLPAVSPPLPRVTIRYSSGTPRKSAAIIPFVTKPSPVTFLQGSGWKSLALAAHVFLTLGQLAPRLVAHLYAAGDVMIDVHQVSVAIGQSFVAATDVHNSLPPNYR